MADRKHGRAHSARGKQSPGQAVSGDATDAGASKDNGGVQAQDAPIIVSAPQQSDNPELAVASIAALELVAASLQADRPAPAHLLRNFFAGTFVAIGALAVVALSVVTWSSSTLINTDRYVKTVTPLVQNAAVQNAIQQYAFTQITTYVDVNAEVAKVLPDNLRFLSAPIATQVESYLNKAIGEIVRSPQFEQVWVNGNTKAHETTLNTIQNAKQRQEVALNLADIYGNIRAGLLQTSFGPSLSQYLPSNEGAINLINASGSTLKSVNAVVNNVPLIIGGLLALIVIMFASAATISTNRRRAVVWVGFGTAIAMATAIVAIRVGRTYEINQIADPVYRSAAVAAWQIILREFFVQSGVIIAAGVAVGVLALLTGPGPRAWYVRAWEGTVATIHRLALRYPRQVAWLRGYERSIWIGCAVTVLVAGMIFSLGAATVVLFAAIIVVLIVRTLVNTKVLVTLGAKAESGNPSA